MKSLFTFLIIALAGFKTANAQNVGIGTDSPHPSSKLHIDANNAGVLIPSLNLSTVTFPSPGPATGLLVYNSNSSYGQGIGFYFNSGTPAAPVWYKLLDAAYTPTLDEDWFEGNTTDSPDDITDNVYTQGNVGIGNFSSSAPASRLHIKDVINGGRAIDVDMTDGVDANSVGLNIRNFAANANARTGINIDMENTSNSNAVNISNIGPTGMNGININSNSTGNGTGIRIGETTALSTGILIRGGTGVLYNASSDNSGTGISIGGTTRPANGVIARAAGPGTGVVGGSFTDGNEQTSPGRTGVFGFAASSSVSGSEIQYGSYSQSRRGGNSGTTRSYGSYSIAEGVNASNNGLHVGAFGTASVENAGTGGAIAGQFNATSNSGRHLALAATGGADVYLGSTDADRPSNFTGANVNVGSGNTNTTYMHNARLSNQLTFRQTAAGTNTVSIVAPSSVTTSYTMTLPTAQGTSNQVLTNDGSGNLSWTNGSSLIGANNGLNITSNNVRLGGSLDASTNIALGNNNLNFTVGSGNTGKVGINTTIPNTYLDIRSNTPKSTTTATEYLFQMGSSANPPLALRQGLAMHSTATNRYASIEVDDDGTKRDLALQPTGGNVGIGVDGIVGTKLYVNDAAGNNLTLERSSTTADDFVGQYFKVHTGTVNTNRKGAIYFQRKAGNGVGNMIFAINNVNSTANVTTADARMTIASSGDVTVHNLGTGLVKSTAGVLSNAIGGTDFENPLTFSNGLTRVTNDIKLGGALTEATTISALTGTNKMSFTGTGVDAFNVDGTTFSVDATNDRVGIGNSAPGHQLSVGASTSDAQQVTIRGYSNTPGSWKGGGAFGYTGSTVIMGELGGVAQIGGHSPSLNAWTDLAINAGPSNVGIGNASPAYKLDVTGQIRASNLSGSGTKLLQTDNAGAISASSFDPSVALSGSGTTNTVSKWTGTYTLGNSTITDDGTNVGIGIAGPNTTLTVRNSLTGANSRTTSLANAIGDPDFELITTKGATTNNIGDVTTQIGQAYGGTITDGIRFHRGNSATDGAISFVTNNATERMRIASDGNITINSLGTGLVKSTSGVLSNATAGTDFENPLTFNSPLIRSVNTISIAQSNTSTNGYLSSADWNTFNNKENALTFSNGLTRSGNNIKLGGALTEATIISGLTGTNKMSFTGTGVDAFNVDGATFSVDATNERVGIGNTTPGHQLSVGAATSDGQQVTIRGYSNTPGAWKGGGAFGYTSSTVIMGELSGVAQLGGHNATLGAWADLAVNSGGGNVGIGNSTPGYKLDVTGQIRSSNLSGTGNRLLQADNNGAISVSSFDPSVVHTGSGTTNYVTKWTGTNSLGNSTIFDNGTNVGVGNTTPGHQLSVGAATSDGQAVSIRGYSNTPGAWKGGGAFGYTGSTVIMGELSGVAQIGGHNATLTGWADLAINSAGGNVGIGESSPTEKLHVGGNARISGLAGTGNRNVYADENGVLRTGTTAKFMHVTYHSYNNSSYRAPNSTNETNWLPAAGGDGSDDCWNCTINYQRGWNAPYSGRLVKVIIRIQQDGGSNPDIRGIVRLYVNGTVLEDNAIFYEINDAGVATVNIPTTGYSFSAGDLIALGLNKRGNSSDRFEDIDIFVTAVWEYSITD